MTTSLQCTTVKMKQPSVPCLSHVDCSLWWLLAGHSVCASAPVWQWGSGRGRQTRSIWLFRWVLLLPAFCYAAGMMLADEVLLRGRVKNRTEQREGPWPKKVTGATDGCVTLLFQAALPDSQINDLKVSATSAMYPVSKWQRFDWSCTNRKQVERLLWRLVSW